MRLLLPLLCLSAPAAAATVPPPVAQAVDAAVAVPGARAVAVGFRASRACVVERAEVPTPVQASGRVAVKLTGRGCGWGWVDVELWAKVSVTTRPVREGEPLDGAVATMEKTVGPGRAAFEVPPGAVAARLLGRGQVVAAEHVRATAAPGAGDRVKIVVVSGPIQIETDGRNVSCGRGRACAVLASGKHVEGRIVEGKLLVELP